MIKKIVIWNFIINKLYFDKLMEFLKPWRVWFYQLREIRIIWLIVAIDNWMRASKRNDCLLIVPPPPLNSLSRVWRRHNIVKSCKFSSMLGGHCPCGFYSVQHLLSRVTTRTRTFAPQVQRFSVELILPVWTTYVCRGRCTKNQTQCMQGEYFSNCVSVSKL